MGEHRLPDHRQIITNRLPATKMRSGENVWRTARRLVETKLRMLDEDVSIRMGAEDIVDEEKESPSYPGLMSLYRKHYVDAFLRWSKGGPAAVQVTPGEGFYDWKQ